MLSSCADQSLSQQLQPPQSSRDLGCSGTCFPFSATSPREGISQLCAANLSPRESIFKSFDSLCHHGCNFCKTKETETNIKAEVRRAALCPDGSHPIFGSQTQEGSRCFLHRSNRASVKLAAASPEEPLHSVLITKSCMDTKHRGMCRLLARWDP